MFICFCNNNVNNYNNKDINNLKKSFQVINKRINYVCKKITPVPPWVKDFQVYIVYCFFSLFFFFFKKKKKLKKFILKMDIIHKILIQIIYIEPCRFISLFNSN